MSFRAVATLWYRVFGLVIIAVLGNALLHGFDELFDKLRQVRPAGWLIIAAVLLPGPLAHWLSIRLER